MVCIYSFRIPGSNEYVVGAPLFKKATIHLENGKDVTIEAPLNNEENLYIKEMKLNGKSYIHNYFSHEDLMNGAKIQIEMSKRYSCRRCSLLVFSG